MIAGTASAKVQRAKRRHLQVRTEDNSEPKLKAFQGLRRMDTLLRPPSPLVRPPPSRPIQLQPKRHHERRAWPARPGRQRHGRWRSALNREFPHEQPWKGAASNNGAAPFRKLSWQRQGRYGICLPSFSGSPIEGSLPLSSFAASCWARAILFAMPIRAFLSDPSAFDQQGITAMSDALWLACRELDIGSDPKDRQVRGGTYYRTGASRHS